MEPVSFGEKSDSQTLWKSGNFFFFNPLVIREGSLLFCRGELSQWLVFFFTKPQVLKSSDKVRITGFCGSFWPLEAAAHPTCPAAGKSRKGHTFTIKIKLLVSGAWLFLFTAWG